MLDQVLASIRAQKVPFDYEIVVADDGSTDETAEVCKRWGVKYTWISNTSYRNPAFARNVAYKCAIGDIVIAQSDEVIHKTNCVQQLTEGLKENEILFATVYNVRADGTLESSFPVYSGLDRQAGLFFLGSLTRRDIYAIGGNDENFVEPCFDDDWFRDCLVKGLGRVPRYAPEIIGWHMAHGHPAGAFNKLEDSRKLYLDNCARGDWTNKQWEYK